MILEQLDIHIKKWTSIHAYEQYIPISIHANIKSNWIIDLYINLKPQHFEKEI